MIEPTTNIDLQINDILKGDKPALWEELHFLRSPLKDLSISNELLWQEQLQKFYFQKLGAGIESEQAKNEIIQFISDRIHDTSINIDSFTDKTGTGHLFTITIRRGSGKIGDIFIPLSTIGEQPFKRENNLPLFSNSVINFLITFPDKIKITSNDIAFALAEEKLQLAIAKQLKLINCPDYKFKPRDQADSGDSSFSSYGVVGRIDLIARASQDKVTKYELENAFLSQTIQAKDWCIRLWEDPSNNIEYKTKLVQVLNTLVTLVNNPDANRATEKIIKLAHEVDRKSSHSAHLAGKLMSIASLLLMMGALIALMIMAYPLGLIAAVTLITILAVSLEVGIDGLLIWSCNRPTELANRLEKVEEAYKDKMPNSGFSFGFFSAPEAKETQQSTTPMLLSSRCEI